MNKNQILIMLSVIGILIIVGCNTSRSNSIKFNNKFYQDKLNRFLSQEAVIGAIDRYNHNNLTSPYRIGPIPKTQWEWQSLNALNSKLGKFLEK